MNYLRGLGGGTGARPAAHLTDDYSFLDGASVNSENNLLAGTPRGRHDGGRSIQGGEQGQYQRGLGMTTTQGGFGQGGIPGAIQGGEQGQYQRGGVGMTTTHGGFGQGGIPGPSQGGEQGQYQRGVGTTTTQGGLGQGGIPVEINDGAYDDIRSQITSPQGPGGGAIRDQGQGPGGEGGVPFSPHPSKLTKGGPPHQGGGWCRTF